MASVPKELFGQGIDHKRSRKIAHEVAALLGSKTVSNERIIIGEPYCPFKIPIHTKLFYCFVFISDTSWGFTANRRPKTAFVADFFVSLKAPAPHMGARVLVAGVSKRIGTGVFRQPFCPDDVIKTAFSTRLGGVLREIDFSRVSQFHFSPIQMSVIAPLDSPESCKKQAFVFRNLMTVANEEAYERNKDVLG